MQVRDECNKALAYCHKHVCGARKAINALKLTLVKRGQLQNFVKEGLHEMLRSTPSPCAKRYWKACVDTWTCSSATDQV